jgi:hypothetical protein
LFVFAFIDRFIPPWVPGLDCIIRELDCCFDGVRHIDAVLFQIVDQHRQGVGRLRYDIAGDQERLDGFLSSLLAVAGMTTLSYLLLTVDDVHQ